MEHYGITEYHHSHKSRRGTFTELRNNISRINRDVEHLRNDVRTIIYICDRICENRPPCKLVEMQALWGEPTSDFTRMRRNRMHVCCGLVAEWLSLASLLCSESMLRRCAKSTFETFELQRPMYVRCKPHVPLLNLNRTHAPSEGDGRTIHDNIYKYIYIYIYIYRQRRC